VRRRSLALLSLLAPALAACTTQKPDVPTPLTIPAAPASASVSAPPPSRSAPPSLTTKESKQVARTLARVSRLRGLSSTRPVPGVTLDRDELMAKIKEKALREYPADALRREGEVLELLGFAPTSFDYLGEMMNLLEAQLEGFYEPNDGTMYLAGDLRGKEAQATLAHELVHALQDQNYDLKARSKYQPGKGDETTALACLAEGDATSVMMDYVLEAEHKTALDLPQNAVRNLMETGMSGASTQSVPHILRSTLIAPYAEGLAFVHALRRKGGFAMVDRAWERPPVTSEQILHVEKWEKGEPALPVSAPTALALGPDFRMVDDDSVGELGAALAFGEWLSPTDARAIAAGWGGDRSAIYVKGEAVAFGLHLRYDDATAAKPAALRPDAFAERAQTKLAAGWKKAFGAPALDAADLICFDRPDRGPLLLARRNRSLFLSAGPAETGPGPWKSAATCAQVKPWAKEVLTSVP
jgi:hypothetical protein